MVATQEVEAAAKDDKGDEQVLTDDSAEYRPVFFKGTSTVNFTCTVNELGNIKFTIPLKNNELELEASGAVGETKENGGAVSSSSVDIVLKDAITFDEFTHVAFDIRNVDGKWAAAAAMSDDRAYESIVTVYVNGQYAGKKLLWERPNLEQVMHTGNPEHVHPLFFGHVPSAFATAGSGQVAGFAPLSGCYVEDVRIFVDGFEDVEENKAAMGGEADVANKAYNAVPMSVHAAFSAVPRHQRVCRNFFDTLLPVLLQDLFVSADDSERMMAIQHNAAEKEAVADSAGLAEDGGVLFSPSGTQWRFDGLGGDAGQSAKLRFTTDTAMELSVYQGDELQRKTLYVCSPSETSNVLQFKEVAEGGGGEEKKEEGATEPKLSFVTADCMKLQWPGSSSSFYCGWRRLEEPLVNIDETNTDELPTNADDANRLLSALECFNLSRNSWCLLSQGGGAGGQVAEAADKPYLLHQSSSAFHEDTMLVCREEGGERASTGFDRARRALQQLLVGRAILTKQQHVQRGMGAVGGTDGKNKSIMFPEAAAFIFAEDVSSTLRPNIKVTPSKDMVVYYEQTLLESGEGLRIGWSADEYQPSDGLPTDAQVFETAHQYTDNMNEKNSVSFAEDPVRGAVKRIAICFDPQSESEQNYDYLRFLPAEDAVDQDGKEGDAVPFYIKDKFSGDKGEVNWPSKNVMFIEADRFVTQFITDGSGTKWGYRFAARPVYTEAPKRNEAVQQVIDQARGAAGERVKAALSADSPPDGVRIFESAHEYSCNMSEETLIEFEGAAAIAIIFDEQCRTEQNYDFLRLRRNAGSDEKPWVKEKFTGGRGSENWPSAEPIFIEASKFVAYFQSDGSGVEWGYRFACAPVMLPADSPPLYDPEEVKAEDALKVELSQSMAPLFKKTSRTPLGSDCAGLSMAIDAGGQKARKSKMVIESEHEYNNNQDKEDMYEFPGASKVTIQFDENCVTENTYDFLVLRKEARGTQSHPVPGEMSEGENFVGPEGFGKDRYMGSRGEANWPTAPFDVVLKEGEEKLFVYFKSDGSNTEWGYKFTVTPHYEGAEVMKGAMAKWSGGEMALWGSTNKWEKGDVVGCSISQEEVRFYLNGVDLGDGHQNDADARETKGGEGSEGDGTDDVQLDVEGVPPPAAFTNAASSPDLDWSKGFYPSVSVHKALQGIEANLGQAPFKFPPRAPGGSRVVSPLDLCWQTHGVRGPAPSGESAWQVDDFLLSFETNSMFSLTDQTSGKMIKGTEDEKHPNRFVFNEEDEGAEAESFNILRCEGGTIVGDQPGLRGSLLRLCEWQVFGRKSEQADSDEDKGDGKAKKGGGEAGSTAALDNAKWFPYTNRKSLFGSKHKVVENEPANTSEHNYKNNEDTPDWVPVAFPGADKLVLVFDPQCNTETNYDFLCLSCKDAHGKLKLIKPPQGGEKFHGIYGQDGTWPTTPFEVEGDTLGWKFHSDGSNTRWGWKFTVTAVFNDDEGGGGGVALDEGAVAAMIHSTDINELHGLVKKETARATRSLCGVQGRLASNAQIYLLQPALGNAREFFRALIGQIGLQATLETAWVDMYQADCMKSLLLMSTNTDIFMKCLNDVMSGGDGDEVIPVNMKRWVASMLAILTTPVEPATQPKVYAIAETNHEGKVLLNDGHGPTHPFRVNMASKLTIEWDTRTMHENGRPSATIYRESYVELENTYQNLKARKQAKDKKQDVLLLGGKIVPADTPDAEAEPFTLEKLDQCTEEAENVYRKTEQTVVDFLNPTIVDSDTFWVRWAKGDWGYKGYIKPTFESLGAQANTDLVVNDDEDVTDMVLDDRRAKLHDMQQVLLRRLGELAVSVEGGDMNLFTVLNQVRSCFIHALTVLVVLARGKKVSVKQCILLGF